MPINKTTEVLKNHCITFSKTKPLFISNDCNLDSHDVRNQVINHLNNDYIHIFDIKII